jgi:hypothetical protein
MSQLTNMTLELPTELLKEYEPFINSGKIQDINNLVIQVLQRELKRLKQAEIDSELKEMIEDTDYQKEVLKMENEFAHTSWEAQQLGEEELKPLKGKVISYENPFEPAVNQEDWDVLQ